ncbi:MAG: hypothetical protein ACE5JI_03380 [Acidobacteriota bacterium]
MKDEHIGKLLRKLPRQKASPGFTENLMRRLPDLPPPTPLGRRPALVAVGTVVLIVSLWGVSTSVQHRRELRERLQTAERLEQLRMEYRALEKELEDVRALAAASRPILELGGTEDLDFVLDLRELARQAEKSGARPVAYRP